MKQLGLHEVEELVKQYVGNRRLRADLQYNLGTIEWDEQDFIVVTNRQGNEGVFLSDTPGAHAVAYELRRRSANSSGRIEAVICDICATWQSGPRSATITLQKPRGRATFLVCADLACSDHVRDKTEAAIISRAQLREHITRDGRIRRLRHNLTRILTE